MLRRFASLLALGALAASVTLPAAAQEDARVLFSQGQAAYETGDYETAARLWHRAYELDDRPLLQYNLAQAYERLGRLDDAVRAYRLYVDNTPGDDPRAQNARARIASLEQRVGQTSILLTGGVEGAHVVIDGNDRGRLPHPDPFRVEPGSHRIVVRAQGYEDFVSTVAVSAGQQAAVPVEMRVGTSGGAADTVGGGIWLPGVFIAAGGGAALVAGGVLGGVALGNAESAPSGTGPEADDARTLALVSDILFGVGGAAVVAGLVLMFVIQDGSDQESAQLVPLLAPDLVGLGTRGRF